MTHQIRVLFLDFKNLSDHKIFLTQLLGAKKFLGIKTFQDLKLQLFKVYLKEPDFVFKYHNMHPM